MGRKNPPEKPCIKCGSTRRSSKKGQECLDCKNRMVRAWREAHPEYHAKKSAAWRAAHPGRADEIAAAWRKANPEKAKSRVATWRKANPLKVKASGLAWRKANPGQVHIQIARRRTRKLKAPGSHTATQWRHLLASYHGQCVYCGAPATVRDHITPLSRKGSDDIDNIVPACKPCNSSKWAKSVLVWMLTRRSVAGRETA